jgi:hypothetical protein
MAFEQTPMAIFGCPLFEYMKTGSDKGGRLMNEHHRESTAARFPLWVTGKSDAE